jgi:hypothetical protein
MLSLLRQQWLALGDRFVTRHPYAWLVWEPGAWAAPMQTHTTAEISLESLSNTVSRAADALCFSLSALPGGQKSSLNVGRSTDNDLVINDATVSRRHATLTLPSERAWHIEPATGARAVTHVGNLEVRPGLPCRLSTLARVRLGGVCLTFYEPQDFPRRLDETSGVTPRGPRR